MTIIEELRNYEVDIEEGLERFMGNEALYIQMIKKFPGSVSSHEVMGKMNEGNFADALANAHTLKGVSGNLSIKKIYNAYTDIVQLLRENKNDEAKKKLEEILPFQNEVIECIKKYED